MKDKTMLKTGIAGSAVAAVCCATPLLVIAFGAFGLSAWLAWADYVLIPMFILFAGMAAFGFWRRRQASCHATETGSNRENAPAYEICRSPGRI